MIKHMITNDIPHEVVDVQHSIRLLSLVNNIKRKTASYHLFCYNLIRHVFNNAELLCKYVKIMKKQENHKDKRNLKKVLAVLRKKCFLVYEDSYITAEFGLYVKSKTLFAKGLRTDFFHRIIIQRRVVRDYISKFGHNRKYFDVLSSFNIIPRYVRFMKWSEKCMKTLSYLCDDPNIILAISNIFVDIRGFDSPITLEFLTWKHLIAMEFENVTFRSDNVFLSLRNFAYLEKLNFFQCSFLTCCLLCIDRSTRCGITTGFRKNLSILNTESALSLQWTSQLVENSRLLNLKLEVHTQFNYQLLKTFTMLKHLNISLNDAFHVDYDGSHLSASCHLSIIDCLVHIRTLRKLLLNGLIISAKTTRALNRLLFVENIRLCFMIFVIPADACGEVNLWSNKVQTLCFQAQNLKKVLLFAKNTRLPNLSKIIMKDELYPIDINFNSIMSVHVQKIRVFVLISGHNPMMITLIEALQGLKTLRIENSSSSFITTLFKSRLIKHRIKELVIVKSCLKSIALRRLTTFTRLKSLMLISVTFVPTLNHKVFSKFKNKFTLRIIGSNINFVDFHTIQKYEKIKSFDCYSKDKKPKTN